MATESEAKIGALEALAKLLDAAAALVTFFRKQFEQEAADAAAKERRPRVTEKPDPVTTIHEAGELLEAVQRCRRCETILADYRGAMILEGDPAPQGFPPGASIAVEGAGSFVCDDLPNCKIWTKIDRIVEASRKETERGRAARRQP